MGKNVGLVALNIRPGHRISRRGLARMLRNLADQVQVSENVTDWEIETQQPIAAHGFVRGLHCISVRMTYQENQHNG